MFRIGFFLLILTVTGRSSFAQMVTTVSKGWAKNSVNTVVFRKNAITSHKNIQCISYYDEAGNVVVAKRKLHAKRWEIKTTGFKGSPADAHRSISIAIDGAGYIHLSWDHHNTRLRYAKSLEPLGLDFGPEVPMTGLAENRVSYPEFYNQPDGSLLFFYRDGGSGNGSMIINRYRTHTGKWEQVQQNLVDGEGKRNAYWQSYVDEKGVIHLSWTWRESPDVASNHDLCYARSRDGGVTWEQSNGRPYQLPINATNAEYIARIPQKSELINQTSMTADAEGHVFIATYWRAAGEMVPQFHVVFKSGAGWQVQNLGFRKLAFSLSGTGTKRIPISRPQIISWKKDGKTACGVIFRDAERSDFISIAINRDMGHSKWQVKDIFKESVGSYEPLFDSEKWKTQKQLYLFVQRTDQADAEGSTATGPQEVKVVRWKRNKS